MTTRREFLVAGAGTVAASLVACGGGGSQSNAAAAAPSTTTPAPPPPTATPPDTTPATPTPATPPTSTPQGPGIPTDTILLDGSASGVARDRYHYALQIPWRGSFIGRVLGSQAVRGAGPIRIGVSSAPECVVLRSTGLWANVHSSESGVVAPSMQVTFADGTSGTLACLADSTIDPSSSAPQGAAKQLILGVAVLRFERPAKAVATATLVAEAVATGGNTTIECCEFISPILPAPPPEYGLRRRGLAGPTLLHQVDFGNPKWSDPWFSLINTRPSASMLSRYYIVDRDEDTGQPLGYKAFRVIIEPTGTIPSDFPALPTAPTYTFPINMGRELDEVYFQYRLRFGEGWRGGSRQSGKLPGIASDTTAAGNGGGTSTGKNGWSFRGLFVGEPFAADSPYNSNNGVVPIGWYTYNPDQMPSQQIYGITLPWTGRGSLGLIQVGKDYWIDQYVKVNTPGKRDGVVRGWINGQLAYERTDHIMRDVGPYAVPGNLAINKIWMTFLHGGDIVPPPAKTLRTYWGDWTIASEYIGPP